MLTIRSEQLDAFRQQVVQRFIGELVAHVREHFPRYVEALSEDGVRDVVQHAMARARAHRIELEAGVRVYFQLMLVLGPSFDVDPRMPWAAAALASEADEVVRVSALLEGAQRHFADMQAGVS